MSDTVQIIIAAISAAATILAVVLGNRAAQKETAARLDKAQAVTEAKLDALAQKVDKHNNFAMRMPVVEEQIKVINHRIGDLEQEVKRA